LADRFRARFKRKFGNDPYSLPLEVEDKVFDMKVLDEYKDEKIAKPQDVFTYKGSDYCYDESAVRAFDWKGYPIIEYYVGNSIPIVDGNDMPKYNGKLLIAPIVNRIFSRGEAKSAIASTQKEPQKLDKMGIIMGAMMGFSGGALVMALVYPYAFLHAKLIIDIARNMTGI
jgi:hypothetical protein